jgi:hypothetical protein
MCLYFSPHTVVFKRSLSSKATNPRFQPPLNHPHHPSKRSLQPRVRPPRYSARL